MKEIHCTLFVKTSESQNFLLNVLKKFLLSISFLHLLKVSPIEEWKVCLRLSDLKNPFFSFYKWILKPFTIFLITSQYNNLEKQKLQWSSRLPDASRWIFLKVNGLEFSFSAIDAGVFTKLLKWVVVNLMDIMNHEDSQGKGPGLSSHFKNSQMKPRTFSRIFAGIHER